MSRDGPLLRIVLSRPERRNAFDAGLIADLTGAFSRAGDARAVILSGEGPSFSAGADVEWMRSSADLTYEQNVADAEAARDLFRTVDDCPAPVVAAVQGHAFGGGCGLLACSDVVVATPGAVFAFSEVRLGIVPAVIAPYVVARIGTGHARRLFVTGERFGAQTALRYGLVHEISDDLDSAVARIVGDILAGGPRAVRTAKRLARGLVDPSDTPRTIAEHRVGDEGQDGLRAFLERRPPSWHAGPQREA